MDDQKETTEAWSSGGSHDLPSHAGGPSRDPREAAGVSRERGGSPPLDDAQRCRIAFHEAGHALAGVLLGLRIELVSIKPSLTWGGVCFATPVQLATKGFRIGDVPLVLQPSRLRRQLESRVVYSLAGRISEELVGSYRSGYAIETAEEREARELTASAMLTPAQREMLALGDDVTRPLRTDEESACGLAVALVAQEEAAAFYQWLYASARALVYSPCFRHRLPIMADELLARETLSGRRLRALIRQANGRTP